MDNANDALKEKSFHANNSEFFVFLPNDLNQIESNNRMKGNENFVQAIAAKDEGNVYFQNQQNEDAVRMYSVAIEKFENSKRVCNLQLAVCYQNRAAATMYMKKYDNAVSDASKAIELNAHYSKAYFQRAKAYNEQRKYYCALQDIVQACILEKFKNKTYTDMVGVLLTKIGKRKFVFYMKRIDRKPTAKLITLCRKKGFRTFPLCWGIQLTGEMSGFAT